MAHADGDGLAVTFEVGSDVAMDWREELPDGERMGDRVEALMQVDTALAVDELDATRLRLVDLKAERIANRAQQAADALDRGDEAKARDVLADIGDVARSLSVGIETD